MATMRIISLTAPSVTEVVIRFTDSLSPFLVASNFAIVSETDGVPDPSVIQLNVSDNVASLTVQPLTGGAVYRLSCISSAVQKFRNINGDSFLLEDDRNNAVLFLGPDDPSEPIFNNFVNYFSNNIYDTTSGTVINSYLRGYSSILSKALFDIRQLKNENYLRKTIIDEQKVRGEGPFDRLNEEGAFEVLRVGLNATGTIATGSIAISSFPRYLVTLQQDEVVGESVKIDSVDGSDIFNINTFVLTLSNQFVTKLHSVRFNYNYLLPNGQSYHDYDVTKYGYQIFDPRYDEDYASINKTLSNDQVKLSDKILSDVNFSLHGISSILVRYQRKLPGRIVDPSTVSVTKILPATLETVQPLLNIFNLQHSPIVDATGTVPTSGGVTFLDPNANPTLSKQHPAFTNELSFSFNYLPSKPGDYAVDYVSGTVYVYGSDLRNNGTGEYPPLATYHYQYTFQPLIDYVYESDTADIVALPNRQLINSIATITFSFEDVLVPNVDYVSNVHTEVLAENIGNNIIPTINALTVQNSPVTNVFRIFNQSQGQIYSVSRWSGNKIYFNTNGQNPNIDTETGERAIFTPILNEVLFASRALTNASSLSIFQIDLKNSNVMSATEDCIGSAFNTSLVLSNSAVFVTERYFDAEENISINLNRLQTIGQYCVDYANGIVYVAVVGSQDYDLGTASYRSPYIATEFTHITNPIDIYYRRNLLQPKDKSFGFQSFGDGYVLPQTFDLSDEKSLNGNTIYPYVLIGSKIGTFINAGFVPGVTNNVKDLRSIYELNDLINNSSPINFATASSALDKTITVGTATQSTLQTVRSSGPNKVVNTGLNLNYLSPNFTISFNVVRTSDSAVLWNGSGQYALGSPIVLTLPGISSPTVGDNVIVTVNISINDLSRMIVDYDRGDYYIDYQYLADEIVVSYEYGENVLDFRKSNSVSEGTDYYVSYRVGALRDALLKNFGSLINIPLLSVFDSTFERERYRDALRAALSSFVQGPTIDALSNIVSTITHVAPIITESIFDNWSLGNSLLYRDDVKVTGEPEVITGVFDNGVLLNKPGQTIAVPVVGNVKLESGTFESWIIPQWNGIDNDAELTFKIKKNSGYAPNMEIFIGAAEYHPNLTFNPMDSSYSFTVSKRDTILPFGRPNKNKNGVFIYLETDGYGQSASFDGYGLLLLDGYGEFTRWYVDVVNDPGNIYNFNIKTNGSYFDVKPFGPVDGYSSIASGTDTIYYTVTGSHRSGIQFVADYDHYVYDYGNDKTGRFSLFKDSSGYLNVLASNVNGVRSLVSADVSYWKSSEPHHVATSWVLNSKDQHDEIHLFIDGAEVPNVIRYGDAFPTLYGQKFRTLGTEEIVSVLSKNITAGNDLVTTAGQTAVTVGQNLSAIISTGDIFYIPTFGFNQSGYTVVSVSGNTAVLSVPMPISITNGSYTVNKATIPISTKASIAPNVTVSLLHSSFGLNDGSVTTASPILTSSANFKTIGIVPGDIVWIVNNAITTHFTIISVTNGSLTLDRSAGITATNLQYYIYSGAETELPGQRAMIPYYSITVDGYGNDSLNITNGGLVGDIVRVRTLGLNSTLLTERFYQWGNSSNVIQTRMPPPIAINDVAVTKILLPSISIGPVNSTLAGGIFTSNAIIPDQPSLSDSGRTLTVSLYGVNVDFSTPATVTIVGTTLGGAASETLQFTSSVSSVTANKYLHVTSVVITCKPVNPTFGAVAVEIKELYPITTQESSATYGVIRFSHQVKFSTTLSSDGAGTFTDTSGIFSSLDVGNYIHVFSPPSAVGYYPIVSISGDHKSCTVNSSVSSFNNGTYEVLDATTGGSGVQNGMFIFELPNQPGQPYNLTGGTYEFKYHSYLSIKYPPKSGDIYLGSDSSGNGQLNAILDEVVILNQKLTDTRVGETADITYGSVTQHFNAPKAPIPTSNTLLLLHMNDDKFKNEAPVYVNGDTGFVQSGRSVNSRFGQSILVKDAGLVVDNKGILNTISAGTIEFWVSPLTDAFNDPNYRYYFDAASMAVENVVSIGTNSVKITGSANQVISVNAQFGDSKIDYFVGGTISPDGTIKLNKALPYENTPVTVHYYPTGTHGDRLSIFKDPSGFVVFNAHASGTDYQVRCPVFWRTGTWHRVKAAWNFNSGTKTDTVRLFIDGFERGNVLYGQGLTYGQNVIYGQSFVGQSTIITTISFKDLMNQFTVGSDYNGNNASNALLDNVRISNVMRPGFTAFNQSIDVNYTANTSAAYPVTKDLYTTYLLDFDSSSMVNTDFASLRNESYGNFDFSVNILDSFGIVSGSDKIKQVLETLINTLKPANSRVFVNYE